MNCSKKIQLLITIGVIILIIFSIKLYFDNQNNLVNDNLNDVIENHSMISNLDLDLDLRKGDSLDQVFNPLRYPSQSPPYYNSTWYPSFNLPANVIECSSRREPCYGGSQIVIPNRYPTQIITNNNISPINARTRGPEGEPQQVGTLYNLNSREQDVYPLFGRRRFPNDDKWEYYTGKADPSVYQEKPFDIKVLKADVHIYMDSDDELQRADQKAAYLNQVVKYLEQVLRSINNRTFLIKNAIEWKKFTSGAI